LNCNQIIIQDGDCTSDEAVKLDNMMRTEVVQSILDWQTRAPFRTGARKAGKRLSEDRLPYEEHFAKSRPIFNQMAREV